MLMKWTMIFNIDNNFDYYDDGDDGIVLMLHQKSRQREHFERAINYVSFEVSTTATADDSLSLFKVENDAQ